MSKRIMNEVICLAEDLGLNIYYQDTDSLHIDTNQIQTLSDEYTKIYGRTLIGSGMGQFHSDFDSGILKGDIHATKSLFLGKKCYIDRLEDGSGTCDYHIRMKGCSNASILHFCKKHNLTPEQLYEKLYEGESVKLDQTCDGLAIKFEYNKKFEVYTKLDFSRTIKF